MTRGAVASLSGTAGLGTETPTPEIVVCWPELSVCSPGRTTAPGLGVGSWGLEDTTYAPLFIGSSTI